AAPTALLTIPFFDTAAAIVRRKLTGRSIYATDREHLHHCLLRRGFSPRHVLFWVSCFCLWTVIGALASLALKNELFAILSAGGLLRLPTRAAAVGLRRFRAAQAPVAGPGGLLAPRPPRHRPPRGGGPAAHAPVGRALGGGDRLQPAAQPGDSPPPGP